MPCLYHTLEGDESVEFQLGNGKENIHSYAMSAPDSVLSFRKSLELLNDNEQAVYNKAAAFCEKEVDPHVEQWEKDENLPREIFVKAGQLEFFELLVDTRMAGGDTRGRCRAFGRLRFGVPDKIKESADQGQGQ